MRTIVARLVLVVAACFALPTLAAAHDDTRVADSADEQAKVVAAAAQAPRTLVMPETVSPGAREKRPALLVPMYVTAGVLQAMDLYTTSRGLKAGAHESNPLIRNGNTGTTLALKAASTAAGIVIAEKMWRKNKVGAVLGMIAANAITSAVVANNYRVIRQLEGR